MHELSIAMALVEQIEAIAQKEQIVSVEVVELVLGVYSGVDPKALEFVFPMAVEQTCAAGARLKLEQRGVQVRCESCGHEFSVADYIPSSCELCGGGDLSTSGGQEIILQRISGNQESGAFSVS